MSGSLSQSDGSSGTIRDYVLYLAWLQAVIATLGSLYFSEVMGLCQNSESSWRVASSL